MKRLLRLAAWLACLVSFPAAAQYGPYYPMEDPTNYTALWWVPAESGWGMNTNHQGNTIFMTLFTYAPDGQPMWLVGPNMGMDTDRTFSGTIYRTSGPPFNTTPWTPIDAPQAVGMMSIYFVTANLASVTYTYNGTMVNKSIQRQEFGSPVPECLSFAVNRAASTNYQDLWWGGQAESGWGVNLVHQGSIMFATLFTYASSRRDMWVVAPDLRRQTDGSFTGKLYSTRGPAFNATPWTPITPTEVGNMTLRFTNGETGSLTYSINGTTVTKNITREVFSGTVPVCN
jgi:hypothetical protein